MSDFDASAHYLVFKDAVTSLITEENQLTSIPACPDWTLRDILGHFVGTFEDVRDGNTAELGQPQWTAAQVARHADADLDTIKRTWNALIAVDADRTAAIGAAVLPDIVVHEFDVRGAVGNRENRDSPAILAAGTIFSQIVNRAMIAANVPALRVIMGDDELVLGEGDPVAELCTTPFEVSRVFTGRRSLAQIRALDWSTDPSPWEQHISFFPPRSTDLVE